LSFGPSSYSPTSGATRPISGQLVTIEGDVFSDFDVPVIVVLKIDGLVWRDSLGVRFVHNPVDDDSLRTNGDHMGNHFGWCSLDSLVTVSYSGKVTIDSISKNHKNYYFDVNADNVNEYILKFGPSWYKPTSGATRPTNGETISITGGLLTRDSVNYIIVYKINGLTLIDSTSKYPWPGKNISNGHNSLIKINSMYNSNTYCSFQLNSSVKGQGNSSTSSIYASITEIDPLYLPVDNTTNIVSAY